MSDFKLPGFPQELTETTRTDVYPAVSPSHALADSAKNLTGAVVITGSGRGIGRATAHAFALAGAPKIVLTARSGHELDEVEAFIKKDVVNVKVIKVVADVSREEDVRRIFEAAGDVEVLINNAGAFEGLKTIGESEPGDWVRTWDVNIKGTYLGTRELLRQIEAKPRASPVTIINTSSLAAALNIPKMSAYNASKSALNRLTELTHYENLGTVRAFAYHPGGVNTKMARDSFGEEFIKTAAGSTPELAAGFALWLATKSESDFLSGRYTSCKWVSIVLDSVSGGLSDVFAEHGARDQDVEELVAKKDEIVKEGLLFTVIRGQEPSRL
ncbi:hypothetical protein P7C70_g2747, partial [Phenoliferia sp. Uapishka_3]